MPFSEVRESIVGNPEFPIGRSLPVATFHLLLVRSLNIEVNSLSLTELSFFRYICIFATLIMFPF